MLSRFPGHFITLIFYLGRLYSSDMCTEKSNYLREKILIIPSLSNLGPRVKVQYFKFLKHFKAKLFYSHILLEIIINLTP